MSGKMFISGLVTGAVIGAAAGMIADPLKDKQKKKLARHADGVFKSIGGAIDTMMMK